MLRRSRLLVLRAGIIFRCYIHEIDTVNTFGRPPLTPHMLSTFTVISDETWKYFAIRIYTGYYRVGHSPLILYYELLVSLTT